MQINRIDTLVKNSFCAELGSSSENSERSNAVPLKTVPSKVGKGGSSITGRTFRAS